MRAQSAAPAVALYRENATRLLRDELLPRLRTGAAGRTDVPLFDVRVTDVLDPLRVEAERLPDGSVAVSISAGYLVFADTLVDAEILGRLADRRAVVAGYFDDVVGFACVAMRQGADGGAPGKFHRRLGWTVARYDETFVSAQYQSARSEIFVQAITWVVAHRLMVSLHGPGHAADLAAAEWLAQSGFAPLPNVGMAMLYFAALGQGSTVVARWRCPTRRALEAGVEAVHSLRARKVRVPREIPLELLQRGKSLAQETWPATNCGHDRRPGPLD